MPIVRRTKNKRILAKARRETDWKKLDAKTDAELTAAAESDPDNPPLTDAQIEAIRAVYRIRAARTATGLSQGAFAKAFRIPVGTVRDWEQGRRRPDAAGLAYLTVIERAHEAVRRALAPRRSRRPGTARRRAA